jgi:hypothetical protein
MSDAKGWWQTDEENDEVPTAPELWRPIADAIGGFDLDPAAGCEPSAIADERYTPADDGLAQPWFGNVWLNPPFSEKTPWYKRLVDQFWNGDVDRAVAVATVDPSAAWFHDWFATADVICYHEERDLYLGQGNSPSFSTMLGAWNPTDDLVDVFRGMGTIARVESSGTQEPLSAYGGGSDE